MERISIKPREGYVEKVQDLGFNFEANYWMEDAYYKFSIEEIERIEHATSECYRMYCEAIDYVIKHNLWHKLHIPEHLVPTLIDSWDSDELSLYGRFDFAMINGVPKLLEFNADTPTSLFEASVIQWAWKEEVMPEYDQFNSIHENLVQSWIDIHDALQAEKYHFACIEENLEDYTTTAYILSTAAEAGLNTVMMDVSDISLIDGNYFNDCHDHLDVLFKLYPYEWMFNEDFGTAIPECETTFIEPLWKAIMSNKYMLVILSELFPKSPYILKASESRLLMLSYCKKPIFSREGANVTLVKNLQTIEETPGEYGEEGFIYQELVEIQPQDGRYPVIGSWVVGGVSCGIGIRETVSRITNNMSFFVPHVITNN